MEDLEIRFTELKNIRERNEAGIAIDEEAFQLKNASSISDRAVDVADEPQKHCSACKLVLNHLIV
jgi:hypothetical protein